MSDTKQVLATVVVIGRAIGLAYYLSREEPSTEGPYGQIDDVDWNIV